MLQVNLKLLHWLLGNGALFWNIGKVDIRLRPDVDENSNISLDTPPMCYFDVIFGVFSQKRIWENIVYKIYNSETF